MKKYILSFLILISAFSYGQSDCISAIPVCGNSNISYTPSGIGLIDEELGGCMGSDEKMTVWYQFTAGTAGTLAFTINPNDPDDDYDFAVYGPNIPCSQVGTSSGQPIRCNYSGVDGPTGLSLTVVHPAVQTQWSGYLDVLPGQTYYLVVDNYSESTNGFTLQWSGTAELLSPFDDPAIQPYPFQEPGQNFDGIVKLCEFPQMFDFSTLTTQIVNGNPNFVVSYHLNTNDLLAGDNPIVNPISVNTTTTYHYAISYVDPNNPDSPISKCKEYGTVNFENVSFELTPATLTACSNYTSGVALYDLTTATVYNGTQNMTSIQYFPTLSDMQNGTNEISNNAAQAYMSAQGIVYVKYVNEFGCEETTTITLAFYPPIDVIEATLIECFLPGTPLMSEFDLTTANITTTIPNTKKFYPSLQDAISDTNSIANPNVYLSSSTTVYARIISVNGCWNIAKINLVVTPPAYSSVLKDKIICIEDRTTLDAGPGFQAYQWSTGATTQVLPNVTLGEYWVDLTTDGCVTRQTVKVYASPTPVITKLDITNNTITITATGGTLPYQYSIDGINWQDSNVFTNVPRGQAMIYVKDAYDCDPALIEVTVPNLINAITPNDDGVNDYLDYSALGHKKNLILNVYDRYGTKIHEGNQKNLYQWDGRTGNKKVETGTYWYTITWSDPVTDVPSQYSGWILVKNRD